MEIGQGRGISAIQGFQHMKHFGCPLKAEGEEGKRLVSGAGGEMELRYCPRTPATAKPASSGRATLQMVMEKLSLQDASLQDNDQ